MGSEDIRPVLIELIGPQLLSIADATQTDAHSDPILQPLDVTVQYRVDPQFPTSLHCVLLDVGVAADRAERTHSDWPRLPSFMIKLSAIPSSREGSRPSATSGLNGSTAIEVIAAGDVGGSAGRILPK